MTLRAVLFDLDGVIVDTAKYHYLAWKDLADRLGIPFDEKINERLKGVSRMASLEIILERSSQAYPEEEKAALAAEKNKDYLAKVRGLTPEEILPGVRDFLTELREAGIKTAVCSASKSASLIIDLLGLPDLFDAVLGGADVVRSKPDPEIFELARDRLGVTSAQCLVVEDAYAGIEAARAAGMKVLGIGDQAILANADVVYRDMTCFRLKDAAALFSRNTFSVVNEDPARDRETFWESVFTLSNTMMGVRGTEDEGTDQAQPGLYIAGLFDQSERLVPEIVNFPDILPIWLEVCGEKISADTCAISAYRRELDMEHGVLRRTVTFETAWGPCTVQSRRFLSFFDRNCGAIEYAFTFADYSGPVTVRTWIDTCQPSREGSYAYDESVMHYVLEGFNDQFEENAYARVRLRDRGTFVDLASFTTSSKPLRNRQRKIHYDKIVETVELDTVAGEPSKVIKYFVVGDSREAEPQVLKDMIRAKLERMKRAGFEEEFRRSAFLLSRHWENADVRIEGDDEMQQMLRYNIYQLIALGPEHTSAFGIGAKGLSSEHYGGHYFWDTEIYLLPFYLNTNPAVARNLLEFRFRTLDKARRRASEQGFAGCLWPWQSDELGNEAIRNTVTPDGRVLRRDILDQYHIVSDVAYAGFQYFHQTGDEDFLRSKLMPIIVESLRFWKSFIFRQNDPEAPEYHIRSVMGPDEYHTRVDDNYYTNFLTRFVFEAFFSYLDAASPKQRWDVEQQNGLSAEELQIFRTIGDRIYLPPLREGVIEQFEGYFRRLDVPITEYSELGMPSYPDPTVGEGLPATERQEALLEHAARTQLIKQADAALPLCLLPEKFTREQIQATFEYYDRRTLQYSSLSPGICAIVGARAGAIERAYQLFRLGAAMDLRDVKSETKTGLHTACHGGTYLGVVGGFAGVRATLECLEIDPRLPAHWRGISFAVSYRGTRVAIDCTPDRIRIVPEGSVPVKVNGVVRQLTAETVLKCERAAADSLGDESPQLVQRAA